MGVIPAHDVEIGEEAVALSGNLFPRVVGVGEARLRILEMLGLTRLSHPDERLSGLFVGALLAQQDASELDIGIAAGVPLDGVGRLEVEEDGQVTRLRHLVGQAGPATIAVRPAPPLGLTITQVVKDDFVLAQVPSHPTLSSLGDSPNVPQPRRKMFAGR